MFAPTAAATAAAAMSEIPIGAMLPGRDGPPRRRKTTAPAKLTAPAEDDGDDALSVRAAALTTPPPGRRRGSAGSGTSDEGRPPLRPRAGSASSALARIFLGRPRSPPSGHRRKPSRIRRLFSPTSPTSNLLPRIDETDATRMDAARLAPEPEKKQKAAQDARDMAQWVRRNCERAGNAPPPYDFLELIGKGASGRVYKARKQATGDLVAIKIVNTDEIDYEQHYEDKDDTIRDFRTEVRTLQQLKDSNAKNVNILHEAFDLQGQLWIVSDYCTGGSVRTLMRAQPPSQPGLDEQYIVIIARELALAIKSVHDNDIIHRDIKSTNVYITETGAMQLGDFGIVGVTDDIQTKRQTMIGTPHYMSLELHQAGQGNKVAKEYGNEVDIWAFGCTIYEMATGLPPNAREDPRRFVQVLEAPPRLEGDQYSQGLRDFVAFALTKDPQARPTASQLLTHPYIANTRRSHPISNLVRLIERYKVWELGGGFRQSLFFQGGAPGVTASDDQEDPQEDEDESDGWNFSTSEDFNQDFAARYSQMIEAQDFGALNSQEAQPTALQPIVTQGLTPFERIRQHQEDQSADRGGNSLNRLWDPQGPSYELHEAVANTERPVDDLPFRSQYNSSGESRESFIDLDSVGGSDNMPTLDLEFATIKAKGPSNHHLMFVDDDTVEETQDDEREAMDDKRATMEWKFPTAKRTTMDWSFPSRPLPAADLDDDSSEGPGPRPGLKHAMTEPLGHFGDFTHPAPMAQQSSSSPQRDSMASMLDLGEMSMDYPTSDPMSDPMHVPRPSTAGSATGSVMTDKTSGNPFDLDDDDENSPQVIARNRHSHHKHWQSDGGQTNRSSRRSVPMHSRSNSLSSTEPDLDQSMDDQSFSSDYNQESPNTLRQQISGLLGHPNHPNGFSPASPFSNHEKFRDVMDYDAATEPEESDLRGLPSPQSSALNGSRGHHPDFPDIAMPDPRALLEDADPALVTAELERLFGGLEDSLNMMSQALRQHGGLGPEESIGTPSRGASPSQGSDER